MGSSDCVDLVYTVEGVRPSAASSSQSGTEEKARRDGVLDKRAEGSRRSKGRKLLEHAIVVV